MRPVFESELLKKFNGNEVKDYEKEKLIWGATKAGQTVDRPRLNPWHEKLDKIMFYL